MLSFRFSSSIFAIHFFCSYNTSLDWDILSYLACLAIKLLFSCCQPFFNAFSDFRLIIEIILGYSATVVYTVEIYRFIFHLHLPYCIQCLFLGFRFAFLPAPFQIARHISHCIPLGGFYSYGSALPSGFVPASFQRFQDNSGFFFPFASPSRFADFLLLSDPFDLFLILGDIAPACTDVSTVKAVTHLLAQGSFVGLKHTPEGTLTASRFLRIILYRVFPRFSLCALGGVLSRCRRFRFSVSFHFLYNMFSETFA